MCTLCGARAQRGDVNNYSNGLTIVFRASSREATPQLFALRLVSFLNLLHVTRYIRKRQSAR